MPTLYTIGYGGRKPSELIGDLEEHDINWVIDVRLRPGAYLCLFRAGHNMSNFLHPGIGYEWMQDLGNVHKDEENWKEKYTAGLHRDDIATKALTLLVEKLKFVSCTRVCLLCAERDPSMCHRALVAREAVYILNGMRHTQKWKIVHIQ